MSVEQYQNMGLKSFIINGIRKSPDSKKLAEVEVQRNTVPKSMGEYLIEHPVESMLYVLPKTQEEHK